MTFVMLSNIAYSRDLEIFVSSVSGDAKGGCEILVGASEEAISVTFHLRPLGNNSKIFYKVGKTDIFLKNKNEVNWLILNEARGIAALNKAPEKRLLLIDLANRIPMKDGAPDYDAVTAIQPEVNMAIAEAKMYGTQTLMAVDSLKRVLARGQDDV